MMKCKKNVSRLLCLLIAALLVLLAPSAVFAADEVVWHTYTDDQGEVHKTYPEKVVINPYTYYDVSGTIGTNLNDGALRSLSSTYLNDWAKIAIEVFNQKSVAPGERLSGSTWNNDQHDWSYFFEAPDQDNTSSVRIDLIQWLGNPESRTKGEVDKDYNHSTGLQMATSLGAVRSQMAHEIKIGLNTGSASESDFLSHGVGENTYKALKALDSNKETKAFYNIVTQCDVIGAATNTETFYNSYGVVFYDFQLSAIVDKDVKYEDGKRIDTSKTDNPPYASYSENKSKEESEVSMELSSELSQTVSNTISQTESFEFTETIGSETTLSGSLVVAGVEEMLKIEVSATQAIETAWEETHELTTTVSNTISAALSLPAHTGVEILQDNNKTTDTVTYTCPVALRFKVAFFSLSGHFRDGGHFDGSYGDFTTIFGSGRADGGYDAPENLYVRAVENRNNPDVDFSYGNVNGMYNRNLVDNNIDWAAIVDRTSSIADVIEERATNIPFMGQGATMMITSETKSTTIGDIVP
ncbi:MAG: aerolysin family beta-barrel pore-forming toxin, partial [Eubacterium sp.]|nr:aerolysin family beta-barrel pore-forming toxin [Eubacterium sp.]